MFDSPFHNIIKRWKAILLIGILIAVLSGFATLLFPLKYKANSQVYIITQNRYGVDPYTNVKSAEKIGENLIQIIKTTDFYSKVKNENQNIDWSYFEKYIEKKKRQEWNKTVNTGMVYGTSVMNIDVYHTSAEEAKKISEAIAKTLVSKAWEYVGGDVTLKTVNAPIVSSYPVKPNVVINGLIGLFVGIFISSVWFAKK
ncbi:MAG: Wzz/FepE/Etk N-terminal domain-containing protein [Patescibacteria group bacterium]